MCAVTSYLSSSPPALSKEEVTLAAPITGMDKVTGETVGRMTTCCTGSVHRHELRGPLRGTGS